MPLPAHIRQLVEEIKRLTSDGIRTGDKTLFFIESTFGNAGPEFLAPFLCGSDDAEAETLFELIFFPDEDFQFHLEPHIASDAFSPADAEIVTERLVKEKWAPQIILPGDVKIQTGIIPTAAIRQFVCRLNIARHIDSRVSRSITTRFSDDGSVRRSRVRLRNGRFPFHPRAVAFLCDFFSRLPGSDADVLSLLELAVELLDHTGDDTDIYSALMDRKRHCLRMLRQAEKCEKDMREQPMEALMLRGAAITSVDTQSLLRQMAAIDRIGLAIYGKTDPAESVADTTHDIDLTTSDTAGNIKAIIKILS